jgi:hypothetical protein
MKFNVLYNPRFFDTAYAYGEQKEIEYNTGSAKVCDGCGRFISLLEWLPSYDVTVSKKKLGDFIFGTYAGFIVSEKFKEKFSITNLKGLSNFRAVNLYYRNRQLLEERYYYPDIVLTNAFVDLRLIEFEEKNLCPVCQMGGSIYNKISGISFLEPEDIKEDIFFTTALGQADIIVSERFKDFADSNGFTNLKLIEASKFTWDSLK